MARSNIPMVINLRQNTNDTNAAYGKYFAEVDSKEPLNLKGFARHMTGHGKIADYQMCVLVLGQVVDCARTWDRRHRLRHQRICPLICPFDFSSRLRRQRNRRPSK